MFNLFLISYRRFIANGSLEGAPKAANMRKIIWNDELARLAERWATQCKPTLEHIRRVLIDNVEVEVTINFK